MELVTDYAPAHWLRFESASSVDGFDWINWARHIRNGPPGYQAYARIRFIPDPTYADESLVPMNLQTKELSELQEIKLAVHALLPLTATPRIGFLALWNGWGQAYAAPLAAIKPFDLPEREFYVFSLSLEDFTSGKVEKEWAAHRDEWVNAWNESTVYPIPRPGIIWPADRAWCLTSDVDAHYAVVGGTSAAIASVLAKPRLDTVPMQWDDVVPNWR